MQFSGHHRPTHHESGEGVEHIEERIDALVLAFGPDVKDAMLARAQGAAPPDTDQDLLNGPQLPAKAHDQAAIDALFSDK